MTGVFPLRWRQVWAVTRWVVLATALPVLWACNSRTLEKPDTHPTRVFSNTFQATLNRKIDMLFMVDNSSSMAPLQTKLLANFPVFMNRLKMLPGGLPDVHIAVVSSDVGPGLFDQPSGHCSHGGDGGRFHFTPQPPCMTNPLNANQTFLQAAGAMQNFTGDIAAAFTCIAALGEGGCGFEGVLASVRKALDPMNTPPENNGFLRKEAFLAVILITNEDDCSVPDDSDLFDPGQRLVSDPYGPYASYRCNEFGHLCNIGGTLQSPPRTAMDNLQGCVSNENGKLTRVEDEVTFLKSLKPDPNKILVAAITGLNTGATPAPEPYSIHMVSKSPLPGVTEEQPEVVHVCMQNSGEYADPAVRIRDWVRAFGSHGLMMPICAPTFAPALNLIADEIGKVLGPPCVEGTLVQPVNCQVNDRFYDDQGKIVEIPLEACSVNPTPPCWKLGTDPMCNGQTVTVDRGGAMLPNDLNTAVACSVCIPGVMTAGCP
jgi:hypothetical protein